MRLIRSLDLIEARVSIKIPPNLKGFVKPAHIQAVIANIAGNSRIRGGMVRQNISANYDSIEEALATLSREVHTSPIPFISGYRSVTTSITEIIPYFSTTRARGLGIYWTFNENSTMGDVGYDNDDQQDDDMPVHGVYTMNASLPLKSIDWADTIPLQIGGVEDEIRLIAGAPIHLDGIDGPGIDLFAPQFRNGVNPNQRA